MVEIFKLRRVCEILENMYPGLSVTFEVTRFNLFVVCRYLGYEKHIVYDLVGFCENKPTFTDITRNATIFFEEVTK